MCCEAWVANQKCRQPRRWFGHDWLRWRRGNVGEDAWRLDGVGAQHMDIKEETTPHDSTSK